MTIAQRLKNLALALDHFAFALAMLGNVKPGEYASSAAWNMLLQNRWQGRVCVPIIDRIFFWDQAHCRESWESQRSMYQATNNNNRHREDPCACPNP